MSAGLAAALGMSNGALFGIGANVLGGVLGSNASGNAADAQAQAAAEANKTQRYMYDTTRADQSPYREVGYSALDALRARMGLQVQNPSMLPTAAGAGTAGAAASAKPWTTNAQFSPQQMMQEDPSYQFRLNEGQKGINRSAAAGSGLLSGATMKALTRYNQDYASNEFGNSWNRLSQLAGVGQNATNNVGAAGQNYANAVSGNQLSAGSARAAGYVGQANAFNNALSQGYNMFQNQQLMNMFGGNQPHVSLD